MRGTVINLDVKDSLGICRAMPVVSLKHRARILKIQVEDFKECTLNLDITCCVRRHASADRFLCMLFCVHDKKCLDLISNVAVCSGKAPANQTCLYEDIKNTLNSGMFATLRPRVICHAACCLKMKTLKYKKIITAALVCYVQNGSLTSRDEYRLRMFEHKVIRGIFRHSRTEVTGGWRKLANKELHDLYTSPHVTKIIKVRNRRLVEP